MYRITHNISIGKFRIPQITGMTITRSVSNLTATCVITLPKKLSYKGTEVSKLIKKGDQVTVEAGYDDKNRVLFTGYVRSVKTGVPLIISCEDEMYLLKQIVVKTKNYPALSLKQLLDEYLPANIEREVVDVNLGEFRVSNDPSLAKVLDYIKQEYTLNFFFRDGKFYAALPSTKLTQTGNNKLINIDIQKMVKSDNIETDTDETRKLIVKVKTVMPDNTKIEVQEPKEAGDGEVHSFLALDKTTESSLRDYAKELLIKYNPGTLKGNLVLYGLPRVQLGDFVKLTDTENETRNGKLCEIQKITYTIGQSYYTQTIEIGRNE